MEELKIHTPFIMLNQALKLLNWAENGAHANELIVDGLVKVNGHIELRKRNKIYPGMQIEFENQSATVMSFGL